MKLHTRDYLNGDVQENPMQYLDYFMTLENEDLYSVAAVTWPLNCVVATILCLFYGTQD